VTDDSRYAARPPVWRFRVEVDDGEARCVVALDEGGEVVGMASAGITRDDDAPTSWELYSVNTVPAVHGGGVADDLLRAVVGPRNASLWVLTSNSRAQGFYRRHGFTADGAVQAHDGTGAEEIRMVRYGAARG